eukprot:TRINITY_DN92108_c0_g1_i1.p1 TRINITY_DN92108_c0_g1~~TRINITY_DN92108_c0_g1_i1.p1  ORF type:complete len:460 (-),score=89.25 TRINITY_DN92108_c0_g1_i1:70-1413(-)
MSCAQCSKPAAPLRCGQCRSTWYCNRECQRKHWPSHKIGCKTQALTLAATVLASTAAAASSDATFVEAATIQTRGAAGWSHFVIDGRDFLVVANFFTSSPGRQPRMETESVLYSAHRAEGLSLKLEEVQRFRTVGAHGVDHFKYDGRHYIAIPNYYGGDSVIYRWSGSKFQELQRIKSDGAGSIEAFTIGSKQMLGIAEFNVGIAAIYVLEGSYPNERFESWQRVPAPGVGAMTTLSVDADDGSQQLLLIAASYVTRQTGWRTRSPVFALNKAGTSFEQHHDVATVGAHDVEVTSIDGRRFVFFSNDKDERTTRQDSELFEWVGGFPLGRLQSRQRVATDGAHAAEFFSSAEGERHFLAVANLGDRETGKYRRDSVVYELDPVSSVSDKPLKRLQQLPTLGATDFCGFVIGGISYVAVSNEQDDEKGGDIGSTIWALRPPKVNLDEL